MANNLPDSSGNKFLFLFMNNKGTGIEYSDLQVYELMHLFYYALQELPMAQHAMEMALAKYNNEKVSKS